MVQFNYSLNKRGNATIKCVACDEMHVVIPSTIDGHIVDAIAEEGMTICELSSFSIYVPKTIIEIGKNAFSCCINAIIYFEANDFQYTEETHGSDAPDAYFGVDENNLFRDDDFDYLLNSDGTVTLTHYNNGQSVIVIPEEVTINNKQYRVRDLGNGIFENPCIWDVKQVIIPKNVKCSSNDIFNRIENGEIIIK